MLEQAENDVLILLDCCHVGTATTSEGSGVTELISACAYNSRANGVGSYSFTKELVIELRDLSLKPSFTVAELQYIGIFSAESRAASQRMGENVIQHQSICH